MKKRDEVFVLSDENSHIWGVFDSMNAAKAGAETHSARWGSKAPLTWQEDGGDAYNERHAWRIECHGVNRV